MHHDNEAHGHGNEITSTPITKLDVSMLKTFRKHLISMQGGKKINTECQLVISGLVPLHKATCTEFDALPLYTQQFPTYLGKLSGLRSSKRCTPSVIQTITARIH